jgi:hypothetical protein
VPSFIRFAIFCLSTVSATARRSWGSSQGSTVVLNSKKFGHGSTHAYGAFWNHPITRGFLAFAALKEPRPSLGSPSTWLERSSAALRSSGPCSMKIRRLGAGSRRKPVFAAHQSSSRS